MLFVTKCGSCLTLFSQRPASSERSCGLPALELPVPGPIFHSTDSNRGCKRPDFSSLQPEPHHQNHGAICSASKQVCGWLCFGLCWCPRPLLLALYESSCSTTGTILGGGRSVFSGSNALGGSKAPMINLSSEHLQNGKAAAMSQAGAQGMNSSAYAGDDSKVRSFCECDALAFAAALIFRAFLTFCSG